jgi:hypothetical protein
MLSGNRRLQALMAAILSDTGGQVGSPLPDSDQHPSFGRSRPTSAPGLRAPTMRCMLISVVSGVEPWTRLRILEDLTPRLVSSEKNPHRPETKHSVQCPTRRLLTLNKWERLWPSRFPACVEVSEGSRQ